MTVVCTDKTGTLTQGEMTVREIMTGDSRYDVSGTGYEPKGDYRTRDGETGIDAASRQDLRWVLTVAACCGNARLEAGKDGSTWRIIGDPTEGALVVAAAKAGVTRESLACTVVTEIPFDSDRKLMSVVARSKDGLHILTKGAPEALLRRCNREARAGRVDVLTEPRRTEILAVSQAMADRALRVLGFAYDETRDASQVKEADLVFAGLTGMIDPPRDEVKDAVRRCRLAGIRPVMITGDHPATATAIAREIGLGEDGRVVTVSGAELDAMSPSALARRVAEVSVYARVTAEHKLRIVKAWQAMGYVVAMTGDGVNDAPAVKAADIGIAMGVTGTEVTKEASDMVLLDDNFATIVNAVEEGRGIYDNIQKITHYLLASNASELMLMLAAILAGWPAPLLPLQILWINLVTDGFPALSLAREPAEKDIMRRPPRPAHERLVTREQLMRLFIHGLLLTGATAFVFWYLLPVPGGSDADRLRAQAAAFSTLAFSQLFYVFACRSHRYTMPEVGVFTNPGLLAAIVVSALVQAGTMLFPPAQRLLLGGDPGFTWEWGLIVGMALAPVTVIELGKLLIAAVRAFTRAS